MYRGRVKKEVFQEDSFSFYALSLSRVTKIPRWALLNWHHRSIIVVVGGGKLIDICMSKKHQLQLLGQQTCKINVVSSANVLHTIFH